MFSCLETTVISLNHDIRYTLLIVIIIIYCSLLSRYSHVTHTPPDVANLSLWTAFVDPISAQKTGHIYTVFDQCWPTVYDVGPTMVEHWLYVSCLLVWLPPPPPLPGSLFISRGPFSSHSVTYRTRINFRSNLNPSSPGDSLDDGTLCSMAWYPVLNFRTALPCSKNQ